MNMNLTAISSFQNNRQRATKLCNLKVLVEFEPQSFATSTCILSVITLTHSDLDDISLESSSTAVGYQLDLKPISF